MEFRNRKLLEDKDHEHDDVSEKFDKCFICYVCPGDCGDYSSPPPLPPSDSPPPSPSDQISVILIIMLAVLGAAFLFLFYLAISRYRPGSRNWRRRRSSNPPPPFGNEIFREDFLEGPVVDNPIWYIRTVGLPQSAIDSISVFSYKKGDGLIEGRDCSVCLSEFEEDERLRLLPKCSHAFHLPCIDTWLRSHKNCPVCRAPVLITNANPQMDSETGSDSSGSLEENVIMNEPVEMNRSTEEMRNLNLVENENSNNNGDVIIPVEDNDKLPEMPGNFNRRNGKFRVMSDLGDRTGGIDRELRAIRRSVSMDFGSVPMIDEKKGEGSSAGKQDSEAVENRESGVGLYKMIKSSSYGRSVLQIKRPVSMKKSFSFGGKRSFRKLSHESIPITELN